MRNARMAATVMVACLLATGALAQVVEVDRAIPSYQRGPALSGNLSSVGSDSMINLMTLWAEGFARIYPNVKIQIEGKGSSTAPPALIAGTAQLGPMSREMKDSEIDSIEQKYGFQPTQIRTSLDVLAVYVNKDNPLQSLSLPEVDAIFSKTRRGGFGKNVTTWGQVGLSGEWSAKPLSLFGRNAASGTYGFFKEIALFKGDYKDTVKEQPGSASVVQGVTEDPFAIGYSGIGYRTSGVRPLALAAKVGAPAYEPNNENALSLNYPLTRYLYVYILVDPRKPMDPLTREFVKYVLSREGQEAVVKDGYLPLPASVVQQELAKLK